MDMSVSFVLPEDVLVFPASDMAPDQRAQAATGPNHYVVTRPNTRQPSTVIDKNGASLIERFREGRTIVDAIIAHSRDQGLDPRQVLGEAFQLLQQLVEANFLVPATSTKAERIMPTVGAGDAIAGWTVDRTAHIVEDTEVYRVRDAAGRSAALKIARPGYESALRPTFRHETAVLSRLSETTAPRLIEAGEHDGRPFLLLEWCGGVPALAHARRLDRENGPLGAPRLLKLCVTVLRAFAEIHGRGVVQGDIHPNNILTSDDDKIRIVDFGRARVFAELDEQGLPIAPVGVPFYYDPQLAAAMLFGEPLPPATPLSEQYCLAAFLREMFAGRPYLNFSLEPKRILQQIIDDPPVPFIRHGVLPWPDVEGVLGRALAKNPADRFKSLDEFADALSRAEDPDALSVKVGRAAPALLAEALARVQPEGAAFRALNATIPTCSVNNGAAGVAYALYRIASVREDPATLATADLWISQAERHAQNDDAFYVEELDLRPEMAGRTSLFHSAAGLSCVEALIALASGDRARAGRAIQQFVTRSRIATDKLDLTFGKSGTLLGCAAVLPALSAEGSEARAAIVDLGNTLDRELRETLVALPPVGAGETLNFGVAHGWAGVLFALMRWREICRRGGPDPALESYLRGLAAHAEEAGEGLRWRWMSAPNDPPQYMAGWCNGSAGLVHLWTLAEGAFGDKDYGELARRAALNAYSEPTPVGDLCCGAAGRSYAMLKLYRHTGEGIWLQRAHELAHRAVRSVQRWSVRRDSLYKGEFGVALLVSDLERPELSCMPLFDSEP